MNISDQLDLESGSWPSKWRRCPHIKHVKTFVSRARHSRQQLGLIAVLLVLCALLGGVGCVVVYQVRFIASKVGRTDYALAGETIQLSCHYIMKDEAEDIKQLIWSKDGKNFLRWTKNVAGLEVLNFTFKGHIDPGSTHSHITIHNTTIQMHGTYKCSVKTDLGSHDAEQDLTVISQSNCKLNDWRVISQPSRCAELFKLDCRNMFPKPVTSCGLWNSKLDKLIRAVAIDITEEPNRQTYRVSYVDSYHLQQANGETNPKFADLLQYAGHLVFKCDIVVPETSWKLSLVHRMFDFNDGCHQDPLETIDRLRLNYSLYVTNRMQQSGYLLSRQIDDFEMLGANLNYDIVPPVKTNFIWPKMSGVKPDLNCWQKPRLGSLARLSCASKNKQKFKLIGASTLECQSSGWVPTIESNLERKKSTTLNLAHRTGRKSGSGFNEKDLNYEPTGLPTFSNDLEEASTNEANATEGLLDSTISLPDIEFIPTTQHDIPSHDRPTEERGPLNPTQLASLLPTCVSINRIHHSHDSTSRHNRMPLLEGTRVLESSNSRNTIIGDYEVGFNVANSKGDFNSVQQTRTSHKSLFEFAFSSSSPQMTGSVSCKHTLMLMLNLVVTLVAVPLICSESSSFIRFNYRTRSVIKC